MPSLRDQKIAAVHQIFRDSGVRHTEQWRTEAEDRIVSIMLNLPMYLPLHQLTQVGELLKWHARHVRGESRTSLMAKCDRSGGDDSDLPDLTAFRAAEGGDL